MYLGIVVACPFVFRRGLQSVANFRVCVATSLTLTLMLSMSLIDDIAEFLPGASNGVFAVPRHFVVGELPMGE